MRLWWALVVRGEHRLPAPAPRARAGLHAAGGEWASAAASMNPAYREFYRARRVMVTGGLGFIGSNLAHQLVALGADVLLVDSLIPDYGGHLFNIAGLEGRVRVNVADVRQQSTMNYLVQDREVIFNLAGQVSHIDSMKDPYTDLEINCRSQLTVLEACRRNNPAHEGRLRRHTTGLWEARSAAGGRGSPRPADRCQRHQQGGRASTTTSFTTTSSACAPVRCA